MRVLCYNKIYQSFLWTILMFYIMYCFLIWPCDILALQPLNFVNQLLSQNSKGFQSELVCCLCLVTKNKQDQVCQTMTLPPDYWLCMINRQMWTLGVIKAGQQIPGKDICWINSHQNLPFLQTECKLLLSFRNCILKSQPSSEAGYELWRHFAFAFIYLHKIRIFLPIYWEAHIDWIGSLMQSKAGPCGMLQCSLSQSSPRQIAITQWVNSHNILVVQFGSNAEEICPKLQKFWTPAYPPLASLPLLTKLTTLALFGVK